MIVAWMTFSFVTGCALTGAAAAADRLSRVSQRSGRFIWLAAMAATTFWPVIAVVRTAIAPLSEAIPDGQASSPAGLSAFGTFALPAGTTAIPEYWNTALVLVWALASSVLFVRLAFAVWVIPRRLITWKTAEVDGIGVHVAPDTGPAVIGLRPMALVLPEWVLEMERPLRELVLRHEAEHRAARDPYLLLIATLVTTLFPWNVALWLQARRLRLAIEIDCDRRVLRAHPRPDQYAQLLLTLAQRRAGTTHSLAPALIEQASNLERRITAMRTSPAPSLFRSVYLSIAVSAAFALACAVDAPESDHPQERQQVSQEARPKVTAAQPVNPATDVFFEFQVDAPVVLRQSVPPRYPAGLRAGNISGEVSAQFVVDETGRVDMQTFKTLKSDDPQFADAVKDALPTWRLDPATRRGKKVKQLVQQSFVFAPPPDA